MYPPIAFVSSRRLNLRCTIDLTTGERSISIIAQSELENDLDFLKISANSNYIVYKSVFTD